MSRGKRQFPWLAILSFTLLAGGGYFITACTPQDSGGDGQMDGSDNMNSNGSSNDDGMGDSSDDSTCKQADDEGNEFETEVSTMSAQGKMLTMNRKVITTPDMNDGLRVETEILSDGALVMRIITTDDGMGKVNVDVEYGDEVPGVDAANIVVENGMIKGTIDGRDINEMEADGADASNTTFADGMPAPDDGASDDLKNALNELFAKADSAGDDCEATVPDMADANSNGAKMAKVLGLPPQDSGHDSDPEATAGCIGCWAGCSTGAAVCIAGVSVACAASLVFYAVCEAAAVAGCAVAYIGCVAGCNATGAPCCPVSCGSVACCLSEETCLNAQIGLCCDVGKTPCVGENCCAATETCIDFGPNAGICCEPEQICGNTCCEATDTCIEDANLCCPEGQAPCDDKCCGEGEECLGDGVCCGPPNISCGTSCCDELANCNEATDTCCGFDQDPCGTGCCEVGESCLGNSCCPDAQVCGNICCPDGNFCQDDNLTCEACPNATDTPCDVGGCCPAGMTCQGIEGICCGQQELYCDGACRPAGECIK
ncbi:MAG: hypothetical protein KDA54_02270 [Phycisphaerales bacterium]|nr:hypothetical protein [Phycisphaerales bacterium]